MDRKLFEMVLYNETEHKDNELNRWGDDGILYALVPIEDQWINVKDRLPEEGVDVLVSNGKGVYLCAASITDGKWHDILSGQVPSEDLITHWMPLPTPPKGDNKL